MPQQITLLHYNKNGLQQRPKTLLKVSRNAAVDPRDQYQRFIEVLGDTHRCITVPALFASAGVNILFTSGSFSSGFNRFHPTLNADQFVKLHPAEGGTSSSFGCPCSFHKSITMS